MVNWSSEQLARTAHLILDDGEDPDTAIAVELAKQDARYSREWELEGEKHRSREDAFRQVLKARTSCFVAASPEYLENLIIFAHEWIGEIQAEIAKS